MTRIDLIDGQGSEERGKERPFLTTRKVCSLGLGVGWNNGTGEHMGTVAIQATHWAGPAVFRAWVLTERPWIGGKELKTLLKPREDYVRIQLSGR